ncbi:MAG: sugar transferase [Butyrivibrio sp.]|nr:sugar transferase [Butyrivibrio sp.]
MKQTNQKNRILETYCLLLIDLIALFISYLLAGLVRFGSVRLIISSEMHLSTCLFFMLISVSYSLLLDWNKSVVQRGYMIELVSVFKYNLTMVIIVACFLFVTSTAADFSRLIWGYVFLFNMALTYVGHAVAKYCLREYYRSSHRQVSVLVVTDTEEPAKMIEMLEQSMPMNYAIGAIAYVGRDEEIKHKYTDFQNFVEGEDLIEQVKQMPFDEVFLHAKHMSGDEVSRLIHTFELMGVICHYSLDITAREGNVEKFGDYVVVSYALSQIDYRRGLIKRFIDIIGGIIGLCITGVLYPFVAAAIKITSKGPVLFSQVRVGKNGRRFKIYKFRSMYVDAEEKKENLIGQNEMSGLMFKIKNDPRITPVGRFLRKTSIDEFPQFYNVLKGDMSLIGTRPPTEDEFEKYSPYYRRRLCMTPGLTGMWQVNGRSEIKDFDEVVKLDLEYIDNWSLTLDFKILLKTIWVVIIGKGSD